ncbi:MAG: carbohydrate kinase family protein [Clostridiales bacterium]|nr:carbohydrate kinase family protein [Clostridiales bacterium]
MNKDAYVVVFGASVVDIFGFSTAKYRPYNSTPGQVKMSFGGVCRNIAENLARVNVNTKFISVIGDDEKGRSMLEHSLLFGYDMSDSLILEKSGTPTYLAILNDMGEMVSGIVDMGALDELTFDFINSKDDIIRGSEYLFLDADSPENLEYILKRYKGNTRFVLDPVSAEKAISIKHLIHHFHTIKPNRYEAEVLSGIEINSDDDLVVAGQYFLDLGIENVFISLDCEGIFFTNGKESYKVTAWDVNVCNVTGAGDSFVAGLGYGYSNNLPVIETIKTAMAMSIIAIGSQETINPSLSIELIEEVIKKTEWVVKEL